tara:strand:+ start:24667 stop:26199 length:1533 start_codon:yes stop_codon:yes gene_type:complete
MYVSLSASLDKYEWYRFKSKKHLEFNDHNRTHDLELQYNDRFGIRKYRGQYKLIDITNPKVNFTLTEKEVAKVVRRSTGYKATIRGVKLTPGVGGLDKKKPARKTRTHVPEGQPQAKPSKYFPSIPMPPKKADILRLYHYFNKLHFDNELPSKLTVQLSESTRLSGQAVTRAHSPVNVEYKLRISKRALTDIPRICSIVLHEMIHIKHHKRLFEDQDRRYANADHGPLFLEDMHRLNKFGYNIDVTENDIKEATLAQPEYVLLVEMPQDRYVILHSAHPFKPQVPELLESIRVRYRISVQGYTYGKTTSSYAYRGNRLTAKKSLPKSKRLFAFPKNDKVVNSILSDIKIAKQEDLRQVHGDVRSSVESAVHTSTTIIDQPYDRFMGAILVLAGLLSDKDHAAIRDSVRQSETLLTADERKFAHDYWSDIQDRHLITSPTFKRMRKVMLKERLDGERAVRYIAHGYDKESFQGRIDFDRYANIVVASFGDIITVPDDEFKRSLIEALSDMH